jgi:hypothetical protein
MKLGNQRAGEPLPKILGQRAPEIGTPRFNPCDPLPLKDMREAANGGFNFRKLRHMSRYGGGQPTSLEAQALCQSR